MKKENSWKDLEVKKDSPDDIFHNLQEDKIGSIQEVIDDINSLILQRETLNQELLRHIDKVKTDTNNFILELGDATNKKEQLILKQKQVELEEARIQEKVNSWRDIALLKRELRESLREFRDKESRTNILGQILEE